MYCHALITDSTERLHGPGPWLDNDIDKGAGPGVRGPEF